MKSYSVQRNSMIYLHSPLLNIPFIHWPLIINDSNLHTHSNNIFVVVTYMLTFAVHTTFIHIIFSILHMCHVCISDINECTTGTHKCTPSSKATCNNTVGGYSCICANTWVISSDNTTCVNGKYNIYTIETIHWL